MMTQTEALAAAATSAQVLDMMQRKTKVRTVLGAEDYPLITVKHPRGSMSVHARVLYPMPTEGRQFVEKYLADLGEPVESFDMDAIMTTLIAVNGNWHFDQIDFEVFGDIVKDNFNG